MLQNSTQSTGDTQPATQSAYDKFINDETGENIARPAGTSLFSDVHLQQNSYKEGDTGHIDLLGGFEQPSIVRGDEGEELADQEDDELDPLSQDIRADVYAESKRVSVPKTPAQQGTKRKRGSREASQQVQTPSLPTNPLGMRIGNHEMMGPSQLFKATQALTSPLNLVSDGLSDRPSPGIHNTQRPSTGGPLSSPIETRSKLVRAVTEPQTTYISMKQSQEAREKMLELQQQRSAEWGSDDDSDTVDSELQKKRQILRDMRAKLGQATTRSRAGQKSRGKGIRSAPTRNSPRRSGMQPSEALLISDEASPKESPNNITEDETDVEEVADDEDFNVVDELAEENKENIEVPMTGSRMHLGAQQAITSQPTPSHHQTRMSTRRLRGDQRTVTTSSSPSALKSPKRAMPVSQPSAVADFQTSKDQAKGKANLDHAQDISKGPSSSLESRVLIPQSQLSQTSRASLPPPSLNPANLKNAALSVPQSSPARSGEPQSSARALAAGSSNRLLKNQMPDNVHLPNREHLSQRLRDSRSRANTPAKQVSNGHHGSSSVASKPAEDVRPPTSQILNSSTAGEVQSSDHQLTPAGSPSMLSPRSTPYSHSKTGSSHSAAKSRPSTLYETAQERLMDSPSKSHVTRVQYQSRNKTSSPAKSQPPRTIAEIAADPSPRDVFGEVDMDNILSSEDIEYQNVVGGSSPALPAPKRRRGGLGQALSAGQIGLDRMAAAGHPPGFKGTPDAPPSSAYSEITTRDPSSEDAKRSPVTAKPIQRRQPDNQDRGSDEPVNVPSRRNLSSLGTSGRIPNPRPTSIPAKANTNDPLEMPEETSVVVPNRVFAHFNGRDCRYYPATCSGVIHGDEPRYRVRFDDGVTDTISAYGIKRLELRSGDIIKVDLPHARTRNFVVEGRKDQRFSRDPETPSRLARPISKETDIHGYATILASAKQRQSVGHEQLGSSQIAVPLGAVYFTQTMWTALKDREYTYQPSKGQTLTGLQTPSERPSTPSTPSSRTRRPKPSALAQSRSTTTSINHPEGLFNNMVFTLTNIANPEDLSRTQTQILTNNGRILENGFDDLFHIPDLARPTSPTKTKDLTFHLLPTSQTIGFTCLITDKHCRRAKYIQALALGIPCLSSRWIADCLKHHRLVPFAPYLLPAGESAYLHGAVRSRVLSPFPTETTSLAALVDARPRMLRGSSILLIMQKGEEAKMKHHNFLTHALGAARVAKAPSADAAAKVVAESGAWDWVYTHERETETEKVVHRGRRRGGERVRVVGNEFVVQSLILGRLAE